MEKTRKKITEMGIILDIVGNLRIDGNDHLVSAEPVICFDFYLKE